ncbi:hypothetical protein F2Z06_20895 [Phocaeicola dorei]|uniref:Uncharacterized protein n=1 Tax=Phocaeicola dorei TaxID=357276 RepID=A0A6L3IKW3_9BACT|nr:hypothetical protein [Phocaeicola dorei]KAA5286431.1 hypothetical protein F2Z06_20895 [Phocaeicola dorei]KAA5297774.1 hypothetical protein F2Z19_20890 [Phocaeicola dorei]KAA5305388.1 hypothetical protein F2Z01_21125 [Phocaeicola dorei]KAA5305725.1 hypothetical protein F2Z00_20925 [Phocaeicola dorei]KAA5313245.1 hypothetical protein F2Z07_22660 [Phocaeicola dorei]
MDDKFELVKKYNIDVDVYIDRDGTTPVGKLSDRNLTKEFLRLYFMGHIAKVWKVWLTDIYMAQTTDGKEIFLPETNISSEDIEKIMNDKRGGKRAGAGPKLKTGYVTTTLRIPSTLKESFKCYIDMYTQYFKGDEENIPYFTNEEDRLNTIRDMMSVLKYEEHLIYERRRRAAEEEENKRQLKLFGDENQ